MSVSINDIHEDLISKLESAVDMGKFLSVFNTLVGVIKNQQVKIDELDARANNAEKLAAEAFETAKQIPSIPNVAANAGTIETNELIIQLQGKIDGLEDKLNNTLLELHGMGEDNSILDREEQPPDAIINYMEAKSKTPLRFPLPAHKKFTSDSPSIKENGEIGEEDSSPVGFSPVSSPPTSSRRPSVPQIQQPPAATTTIEGEDPKENTERSKAPTPTHVDVEETRTGSASNAVSQNPSRAPTPALMEQQQQPAVQTTDSPPTLPADTDEEAPLTAVPIVPAPSSDPTVSSAVSAAAAVVNSHHHHQHRLTQQSGSTPRQGGTDSISPLPTPGAQHSRAQSIAFRSGLLTVTPLEQRPSAMRESFSTKLAQVEAQLFPVRDELLTKSQKDMKVANALWKASVASGMKVDETYSKQHPHLHRRIIPHYHKYHMDADLPYERRVALAEYRDIRKHDRKESMDAKNLTLLSPERRANLVRQLKQKGRFIQISRNMLEDSRQKYAQRSLKQNVEFVEAETRRLFNRVNQLRDTLKHQYNTTRYLLPVDFHETFDRLVDFLEHMELKGGVEEIMALPRSDTIMCFGLDGSMPASLVNMVNEQIKPLIHEALGDMKTEIKKLQEESLTHNELAELMMPESSSAEVGAGVKVVRMNSKEARLSDPYAREKELARKRTISLIKECIAEDRKEYEIARVRHEEDEACIKEHENQHQATVNTVIHAHTPVIHAPTQPRPKTPSMIILQQQDNAAHIANKIYIDEKVTSLEEQVLELRLSLDSTKDTTVNDMACLKAKLEKVEAANAMMLEHDNEAREQRRKDAEALKIMQKRLANVSVDNVMDELKVLQLQVNDRPSTSDVGNMMEGISMTFRKHLGENVVGLRSLVDQVYRQIHRKVNREDIKKLISAKLSQMEHEILKREEEMFTAASSTRCMSCGQLPPDPTNAFVNHTATRRTLASGSGRDTNNHPYSAGVKGANTGTPLDNDHNHHSASTTRNLQLPSTVGGAAGFLKAVSRPNTSPALHNNESLYPNDPSSSSLMFQLPTETATPTHMDDEISLHSERSMQAAGGASPVLGGPAHAVMGPVRSEEVYNVLTGSAGLKSLMPQHTPMVPMRDPYSSNTASGQLKPPKKSEKIPEPMYRKAKMAAHLKEMVKVSGPSAQTYGYNANNPFFVMEGYSTEELDPFNGSLEGSSLYSNSRNGRARPRTQSGNPSITQGQHQQGSQQVYVPIPRNSNSNHAHTSATQLLLASASQNMVGERYGDGNSNIVVSSNTILPAISNKTPRQATAAAVDMNNNLEHSLKTTSSKLHSYV